LAEAWKDISIGTVTGANQYSKTYWWQVKTAFDERKFIDPYFRPIHVDRGSKAMGNHWGIVQDACSKWHGIQDEIKRHPESSAGMDRKVHLSTRLVRPEGLVADEFHPIFTDGSDIPDVMG
jgi:hypothetical protein